MDPHLKRLADLLVQVAVREMARESKNVGNTQKKAGPVAGPADSLTTNIRSIGSARHITKERRKSKRILAVQKLR